MSDKQIFRVQFFWTSEAHKNTPTSNIFIRGESLELAEKSASEYFDQQIIAAGIRNATYRMETKPSSLNEAALYVQQKLNGQNTERTLN